MDESQGNASSLPPFLTKTYEMLEDPSTNSIVSWSQNDKSFIVWNPPEFSRDLLPRFFKHNNFSSFIRQLNTYGFRKIDPEKWEFANDDFIRGQPYLMKNIHRRKPVHSHSLQNVQGHSHSVMSESERRSLNEEIDMLKKEKQFLVVELERQEQERQGFESQILRLKERLREMEQRQKSTLDFVSGVLKKRGFVLDVSPNLESNDRKRRFRRLTNLLDEVAVEENQVCVPQKRSSRETSPNSSQAVQVEQLELSLGFWENVIHEIGDSMVQPSLNFEAEESVSCAEDPDISCIQLNDDICTKSSKFDMNSEPVAPKEQPVENTGAQVPTGVNDVFWEQFLTENPGSTDQQEIQSERKDFDGKNGKFWWNPSRSVNDLVEQMGHLTPAKRA